MRKAATEDMVVRAAASQRILSFDIIRGFLLLVILVGHIELPPNFYDFFTGRGRLYVSAAEGFFFLSGLLVGMVYRRKLANGLRFIFKKMWARAAELYVGSVIFTLLYSFIVAKTNHFYIKPGLPNPVDWHHTITQTLLLRFEYGWADFLGRFAILMLIAPVVFYFIAKGRWRLVLLGILVAYLLRRDNFTLGWQLIFNGGMLIGYYWSEINRRLAGLNARRKRILKNSLVAVTAVSFTISYAAVYVLSELNQYYNSLSPGWQHFALNWDRFTNYSFIYADKWTMGPLRVILFFIWASVAYMFVKRYENQINGRAKGLLLVIGQNSLFVYIFHSIVVFVFKYFIPVKTNPLQNFAIVSLGLAIVIGGTYLYRYTRLNWPHLNSTNFYSMLTKKGKDLLQAR
jgi:hypothetical protein